MKQFLALPLEEQGRLKAADGWFVGGRVEGGRRNRQNVHERDLLTFDIDGCDPRVYWDLRDGVSPLSRYEFMLHQTRKHTDESPRVRVVMPVAHPVPTFQYEPVMRIVGAMLDPTLDGIDDVTFRASQLMYWPTICRDSLWEPFLNRGELLDSETVLESFGADWRDFRNLPYSEKRSKARRKAEKSENPQEKRGVIGAFNRAYSVPEAIAEFLSEVYTPGDDSGEHPRYTYAAGSVANGAIVYDDGLFLYSHHDTDPAGHQNIHAADLVRVHKFGHLDEKTDKEDVSPSKWPSFLAFREWAESLPAVAAELVQENYDLKAMFDDLPDDKRRAEMLEGSEDPDDLIDDVLGEVPGLGLPEPMTRRRPKLPEKDWESRDLDLERGKYKQTLHNSVMLIANDPRLWGVIGMNAFSGKITARRSLISKMRTVTPIIVRDEVNGEPWQEINDYSVRALLEAPKGKGKPGWGYKITDRDVRQAIRLVSEMWRFHPVQEYIEGLRWDGIERVETMFIRYLGVPDTAYARQTARLSLIAIIARIYHPGHKWDHVPIISGKQGIRKSAFVKVLARNPLWFGALTAEMASGRDTIEQMLGKIIVELPELAHMRKSDVQTVKQFITLEVDEVRLAYDARISRFPRQGTFWGTSNEHEYLKDTTGNRRFWPLRVTVDLIDTDALEAEIDQIWAEAYQMYRAMCVEHGDYRSLPLMLTGEAAREAEVLQNMAREEDSLDATAAMIQAWLDAPTPVSTLLNGSGGLAAEFTEKDEPLGVRIRTCAREAYCETLGIKPAEMAKNRTLEANAGETLAMMEGWTRTGERHRFPVYGRCREYVRSDATAFELARGYRIVR